MCRSTDAREGEVAIILSDNSLRASEDASVAEVDEAGITRGILRGKFNEISKMTQPHVINA